jgi:hypothetical protein
MVFTVVHFLKTNTVEAVPSSWIVNDDNGIVCFWPMKSVSRHIREQTPHGSHLASDCLVQKVCGYTITGVLDSMLWRWRWFWQLLENYSF